MEFNLNGNCYFPLDFIQFYSSSSSSIVFFVIFTMFNSIVCCRVPPDYSRCVCKLYAILKAFSAQRLWLRTWCIVHHLCALEFGGYFFFFYFVVIANIRPMHTWVQCNAQNKQQREKEKQKNKLQQQQRAHIHATMKWCQFSRVARHCAFQCPFHYLFIISAQL